MKASAVVFVASLFVGPAVAQKTSQPPLIEQIRPGVTYEDCVTRCKNAAPARTLTASSISALAIRTERPGASPLPVVCPQYS